MQLIDTIWRIVAVPAVALAFVCLCRLVAGLVTDFACELKDWKGGREI